MVLPQQPTLVELRRSVAIRSGLATQNDSSLRYQAQADEFINKAQRIIDLKASWARRNIRATFAATTGTTDYDIPNNATLGAISRLAIQNADGVEVELFYDNRPAYETLRLVDNGQPVVYRVIDEVIRVLPAVDATLWPTFIMEYQTAASTLVLDSDRCSVDAEAVIQFASTDLRKMLGLITLTEATAEKAETFTYLNDLQQELNPSRAWSMVSSAVDGPAYIRYGIPSGMGTSPYYAGWSPW